MADETTTKTPKNKASRSARLGDRVFLWTTVDGEMVHRPAILADYFKPANVFSLVVTTPQGMNIPYAAIPWSDKPKPFHWTFPDVVPAIQVDVVPVLGGEASESRDI